MLKTTKIFFIFVIGVAFCANTVMGTQGMTEEECAAITGISACEDPNTSCIWTNRKCHACASGTYLYGLGTQLKACMSCPSPYTQSDQGSVNIESCYTMVGSEERYYYGQTLPCGYYGANENTCESQPECVWTGIDCMSCPEDKYPNKTKGTCMNCPESYPKADAGATGAGSCYKECNASLSPNGNILSTASSTASYGNECNYTYTCNPGYYQSGSATAPQCSSCSNMVTVDTNATSRNYTTNGPNDSDTCPWEIVCEPGFIFDTDLGACTPCPSYYTPTVKTGTSLVVTNYQYENGQWFDEICADYTDKNNAQQHVCSTDLPMICEPNVYTVTLDENLPAGETPTNTYTITVYERYDDGWYTTYVGGTVGGKITATTNQIIKPITTKQFTGYWTSASGGTMIFDANGQPIDNTTVTQNTTLYAQWSDPIPYTLTIKSAQETIVSKNCSGSPCSSPLINDQIQKFAGLKNASDYGTITFDPTNKQLTFTPNTTGITNISNSRTIMITLDQCDQNYYCNGLTNKRCPFGTTSDAGQASATACYFKNGTKLYEKRNNTTKEYEIPGLGDALPYMATDIINKLSDLGLL